MKTDHENVDNDVFCRNVSSSFNYCVIKRLFIGENIAKNHAFSSRVISVKERQKMSRMPKKASPSVRHRSSRTHAKTPQTCYRLLHLQAWYRYDIIAVSDCCRLQTVQNWRYQTGTVCWFVRAVSVWCNRMIQVCWEQTVRTGCNRHDGPTTLMEAVGIR